VRAGEQRVTFTVTGATAKELRRAAEARLMEIDPDNISWIYDLEIAEGDQRSWGEVPPPLQATVYARLSR
jgi:hypothetical protein